jgi:hypothetical protein
MSRSAHLEGSAPSNAVRPGAGCRTAAAVAPRTLIGLVGAVSSADALLGRGIKKRRRGAGAKGEIHGDKNARATERREDGRARTASAEQMRHASVPGHPLPFGALADLRANGVPASCRGARRAREAAGDKGGGGGKRAGPESVGRGDGGGRPEGRGRRKAEGGRRKAEGGRRKAEGGRRRKGT